MTVILSLKVIKSHKDRRCEIELIKTQSIKIRVFKRFKNNGLFLFNLFKTKYNYRF
jgi:hypothetical protein